MCELRWSDMKILGGNDKCGRCGKRTGLLVEYNGLLLCSKCFREAMDAFTEGRWSKLALALAFAAPVACFQQVNATQKLLYLMPG